MICPNCGKQLNENEKYCDNCGTNLNNISQTNQQIENQNIQTETNQLTNENVQPMYNEPVSIQPEKSQETNKKNNTGLVIIVIILIIVLGLLVYFFVIKKDDNKTNNTNTNQQENNTTTTTKNINQQDKNQDEKKYKLANNYQKYIKQFTKIVTTKESSIYLMGKTITFKINSKNEIEKIEDGNTTIENINGEKAKNIITSKNEAIYILTEEGNIYIYDNYQRGLYKLESNYKFENLYIISREDVGFDANNLYDFIPIGKRYSKNSLILGKSNNEYITINTVSSQINLGNPKKYLIERMSIYDETCKKSLNEHIYAYDTIFVYSDGSTQYVMAEELIDLNNNKDKYKDIIEKSGNIKNGRGGFVDARIIFKQNENIYLITTKDQIYEITPPFVNRDVIARNGGIMVRSHNNTDINTASIKNVNILEKNENELKKIEIVYLDGTTETLEGNGSLIFE